MVLRFFSSAFLDICCFLKTVDQSFLLSRILCLTNAERFVNMHFIFAMYEYANKTT